MPELKEGLSADSIVSDQPFRFWATVACNALRTIRPFIKMSEEQGAAYDMVEAMLCGGQ